MAGSNEGVDLAQALRMLPASSRATTAMVALEGWIAASTLNLIIPVGGGPKEKTYIILSGRLVIY
jgi:hypothetical protein